MLAIETDEDAHRGYDAQDEVQRYDDLFMIFPGKWIFIRFNPDEKGTDIDDKIETLMLTIEGQIDRIESEENTELVEIVYLFYGPPQSPAEVGASSPG